MIPDRESMIKVARRLEEAGHHHGWGIPGTLGTAYYTGIGIQCEPFPIQPGEAFPGKRLDQAILALADRATVNAMVAGDEINANKRKAADATAAVWIVAEGQLSETVETTLDRRLSVQMHVQRVRTCIALDCGGLLYHVVRAEGGLPSVEVFAPDEAHRQASGVVIDALRRMLLSVGAFMADGQIDRPKVAAAGRV